MTLKRFLSLFIKITFLGDLLELIYAGFIFFGVIYISTNVGNGIALIIALIIFIAMAIAGYFWVVKRLKLFFKSSKSD